MNADQWRQLNALLDAVMDLPPGEQQAYLDVHCSDDSELRREVVSLLQAHGQARSFLEKPANDFAATLISMANERAADPLVGEEIDGYRILGVLGRGGMGIVYQAEDVALSRTVALKMIDPALARDEAFVRRFRAEARALARIDSAYIVGVHAMRQSQDRVFIVMEYVDGGTVADLIQQGAMPWQRAIPLVVQMLTALEHAHSVSVIHRDIKPSNIMLSREGTVKVTDFGLAKLYQGDGAATVTKGIAGTLYYMSPEQVRGLGDLDHRSDLYSMGVTIYQMLAGQLPFDRDASEFTIMRAIVEDAFPPPSRFRSDLPSGLVGVVMRALEKDPARRYQSAREMREAFEGLLPDKKRTDLAPTERKTRKPWLMPAAIALAVLVLAAAGYLLLPPSPAPVSLLFVTSTPSGATVYHGAERLGETPLSNYALEARTETVALSIRKERYTTLDTTLRVAPGAPLRLDVALEEDAQAAQQAGVNIVSTPGGARVQINGREYGATDASTGGMDVVYVEAGAVDVEVSKNGYRPWKRTYNVAAGDVLPVNAQLQRDPVSPPGDPDDNAPDDTPAQPTPTARLTLNVDPPAGTASVAGEASCGAGRTCTVTAGQKTITFSHPDYGSFTERVSLPANGAQSLTYYFEATVAVQVRTEAGQGIWASILVDGQKVAELTDKVIRLGPGEHRIAVERAGYTVREAPQTVQVKPSIQEPDRQVLVFHIKEQ